MSKKFEAILQDIRTIHEELVPIQVKQDKIKPASKDQIEKLEEIIQDKLPEEVVIFLKTQKFIINFNGAYGCFPVEQIIKKLNSMNDLLKDGTFDDGRVKDRIKGGAENWDGDFLKKVWWSPKWVPFAMDGGGNLKCIDLDPGRGGVKGQIVSMKIQDGQGPFVDNADSFHDYMEEQLKFLKEKRYTMEEYGDGGLRLSIDRYSRYED